MAFKKAIVPITFVFLLLLALIVPCSADSPFFNYERNGAILAFGGNQNYSDIVTLNATDTSLYLYDTIPFASSVKLMFPFYGASRLPQMNYSYPCNVTGSYWLVFNDGNRMQIEFSKEEVTSINLGSIDFSTAMYIEDMIINVTPDYTPNTDPNDIVGVWLLNSIVSGTMFSVNTSYTYYVTGTCSSVGDSEESISFDQLRVYRNNSGLYITADDTSSGLSWDIVIANESQILAPLTITSATPNSQFLQFLQLNATKQGAPQIIDIALDIPQSARIVSTLTARWTAIKSALEKQISDLQFLLDRDFTPFNWIVTGVDAFLGADIGIGITLGGLVGIVVAFALIFIFLRLWGGG